MKDRAHVFVPMGRSGYQHCCVVCGNLEYDEEHTGGEGIGPPSYTELRNQRRTIVGMPAPEHLPAETEDTIVMDDPDVLR